MVTYSHIIYMLFYLMSPSWTTKEDSFGHSLSYTISIHSRPPTICSGDGRPLTEKVVQHNAGRRQGCRYEGKGGAREVEGEVHRLSNCEHHLLCVDHMLVGRVSVTLFHRKHSICDVRDARIRPFYVERQQASLWVMMLGKYFVPFVHIFHPDRMYATCPYVTIFCSSRSYAFHSIQRIRATLMDDDIL